MGIDSKSLNAAAVSGQGAQSNAAAINKSTPVKKSSSSTDSRSTTVPNNTNAQRIFNDVNSNSAAIAAATVTGGGPKFNPYLFPYMPQQMPMPSMSAPQSTAPKVASTNSRRDNDGGGGSDGGNGGGGNGGGNRIPNGGFKGAIPPNGDNDIGAFKKEEAKNEPKAEVNEPKAEAEPKAKEPEKPTVKEESQTESKEENNKPPALSSLDVGFGEFTYGIN